MLTGSGARDGGRIDEQVLAANLQTVFLVAGLDNNFNLRRLERYLAAAWGGGVDFLVGRHFMIGFNGAYNFVEKLAQPIGGRSDYSGSEFGLSFSWLLGRGGR